MTRFIINMSFLILILLGLVMLMNGCQSSPPKWSGYRFDHNWKVHKLGE